MRKTDKLVCNTFTIYTYIEPNHQYESLALSTTTVFSACRIYAMLHCEAFLRVKLKALVDRQNFKRSAHLTESTLAAPKASDSIPKSRCGYRLKKFSNNLYY